MNVCCAFLEKSCADSKIFDKSKIEINNERNLQKEMLKSSNAMSSKIPPKVKGMSGRITPTILPGIAGRSDTPARDLGSKINRKRKKTRKKKRRGGRGRR